MQEADGQPYRIRSPLWFSGGLVLDFTNPEAVEWWLNKRAYLLDDTGVDGFKTDGGEHLWGQALRFADGRRGDEVCNIFPNLYVGAYHRFARDKRKGDSITFSRAGFAVAQAHPCHWAGDEDSTWEAFRASILAGLNAGISGIPFWGRDLAGFGGEIPSAELYLRATAMAAFCPIMQHHSEYNEHRESCRDRTPWNIQERTGDADVIPEQIVDAVVVGNRAMHHLFAGLPVSQLGLARYVPCVSDPIELRACDRGLRIAPSAVVYLPPVIAGYVGADHVAMLLATGMERPGSNRIALDIGTNTETSLATGGRLLCCSCASGPAFGGGHIKDGMRASPGAIERVQIADGDIGLYTVDGQSAVGV